MAKVRVLVVEDEAIVAMDVATQLEDLGYEVAGVAATGDEAIAKVASTRPDLVLMDIVLPGAIDGVEAAETIRRVFAIPVVYLTAYDDDTILERAKITQPFGYIVKPLQERELHKTIEIALYTHEMQHRAREREQWLATTLASIGDAVLATDTNQSIVFMNAMAEAMTGWDSQMALGKRLRDVCHTIDEHSRERFETPIARAMREGVILRAPNHILVVGRDGKETAVDVTVSPIKDTGGWTHGGVVLVFHDLTERRRVQELLRESERQYRQLVEQASDAIIVADAEGRCLAVNPSGCAMLGYTADALVEMPLSRLLFSTEPQAAPFNRAAMAPGEAVISEYRLRRQDGAFMSVEVSAKKIEDGRVQLMIRDITERKSLEEQLRQAHKLESIGRLAGGVAHDFNNLLMAMLSRSDLALTRPEVTPTLRRDIGEIKRAGERAATLVRQLLAFSRSQVLQPSIIDLNEVIADLNSMLRRLIGEDIQIVSIAGPALGLVRADPGQIEQVIMNLAVNARDAMPQGGHLVIETRNVEIDEDFTSHLGAPVGKYALMVVSDTGYGMDAETQSHIFEPFFTTKPQGQGTGLGLSTVYGIVTQSNGYIRVRSSPGSGASFEIYLPRVEGVARPEPATLPQAELPQGTKTILLAEDDDAVRDVLQMVLDDNGYKVLIAENGEQALTLSREYTGHIHMLITDVVMPHISGVRLAQLIAEARPDIKVLYMSGYADDVLSQHGALDSRAIFLQKPFDIDDLLTKMREVLDKEPHS